MIGEWTSLKFLMSTMRPIVLVLLCVGVTACGWYFAPDRNVERHLTDADVVGTWRMTATSQALLQQDGFSSDPAYVYTITFHADGSLDFASVLDDFTSGAYEELPGMWQLEHDTTGDSNYQKANVLRLELQRGPRSQVTRHLNFTEDKGSLRLWNYYGDPDAWEFIEYEQGSP